jgi:hypothetical protein
MHLPIRTTFVVQSGNQRRGLVLNNTPQTNASPVCSFGRIGRVYETYSSQGRYRKFIRRLRIAYKTARQRE